MCLSEFCVGSWFVSLIVYYREGGCPAEHAESSMGTDGLDFETPWQTLRPEVITGMSAWPRTI